MDSQSLSSALTQVATAVVIFWLLRKAGSNPNETAVGDRVLRYPRIIEAAGWGFLALFLAALVLTYRIQPDKDRIVFRWIFAGASALFFTVARMGRRCVVGYNDEEVYYVPIFGSPFTFRWADVESVRYPIIESCWVFFLSNGRKARISPFMTGYKHFIKAARRNVGVPVPQGGKYG